MQIHIHLFANLREFFGTDELHLNMDEPCTVKDLMTYLQDLHPDQAGLFQQVMVAKNHKLAGLFEELNERDEIALIPPVGGGEWHAGDVNLAITNEPLDIALAYHLLESPYHGGSVVFTGTVREWTKGAQTAYLEYEAYHSMALQQMRQIQSELESQYEGVKTVMWHRVGKLYPTDIAVLCGASHAHRDEAFLVARSLIERLKHDVTIWKKEYFRDGKALWQANSNAQSK